MCERKKERKKGAIARRRQGEIILLSAVAVVQSLGHSPQVN